MARWGNLEALLVDVAITRLAAQSPIPDTGSLAGDLRAYAANVARDVSGPDGLAVLRLVIALSTAGREGVRARAARERRRGEPLTARASLVDLAGCSGLDGGLE